MIKLKDVSYTYKNGVKALKNVNLNINSGEITVIIGNNGSGKSTLGNVTARIFKPSSGNLTIDNQDINKLKTIDIRKKIGIVFQNPNNQIIFNRVYDDIAFTLNNLKVSKEEIDSRIKDSLRSVSMDNYINNNPYELSLGQKQRIAIANVLAVNPKYIVFDEATSMLDARGKKDIYNIVKDLASKNVGVVFITNMMDEILLADKLVVIDKGEIIKVIKKEDIIDNINILSKLGMELPFIIRLIMDLKKKNINLNKLDEDEILSLISKDLVR
jgi:energy-coupling factor transport system ATP-binding protein